jgi:hypothetical protein
MFYSPRRLSSSKIGCMSTIAKMIRAPTFAQFATRGRRGKNKPGAARDIL